MIKFKLKNWVGKSLYWLADKLESLRFRLGVATDETPAPRNSAVFLERYFGNPKHLVVMDILEPGKYVISYCDPPGLCPMDMEARGDVFWANVGSTSIESFRLKKAEGKGTESDHWESMEQWQFPSSNINPQGPLGVKEWVNKIPYLTRCDHSHANLDSYVQTDDGNVVQIRRRKT